MFQKNRNPGLEIIEEQMTLSSKDNTQKNINLLTNKPPQTPVKGIKTKNPLNITNQKKKKPL